MTTASNTFKRIAAPSFFSNLASDLAPGPVVIVGAGLGGLFTALKLAPHPVTVISPKPLGEAAASAWALGGIAAAFDENDSPSAHAADTIKAGGALVDENIARMVAEEAPQRVEDLLRLGVPFDRKNGGFVQSREAAHSANRVVRVSGDRAGAAIMQKVVEAVRRTPSIRILDGYIAEDLRVENNRTAGVVLRALATNQRTLLAASAIVLATGGIGALYSVTTNPAHASGTSLAMAARAGAAIADAEFVQFHPTALDLGLDPAPLATESLRGEGATLINKNGERFMVGAHPDADLGPRDIVARAVFEELHAGRGAYLDCREAIGDRFSDDFPTAAAYCKRAGLNPARDLLPVAPAAHYHMGGIATDERARTSVTGLWAVGETASTGLHGGNRLASNSLLECLVFGTRAATDIAELLAGDDNALDMTQLEERAPPAPIDLTDMRKAMFAHVGVVRDNDGLTAMLDKLDALDIQAGDDLPTQNALAAARLITTAALLRTESRSAHARRDFPQEDAKQDERIFLELDASQCKSVTMKALSQHQPLHEAKLAS